MTCLVSRLPIADIFQTKRRRRRRREAERYNETSSEEEDYDFWADEYDDYDLTPVISIKPRIDFAKYSKKEDSSDSGTEDSLPRDIFCDLVNTLNTKCGMSSLLEMWRYEEDIIKTTTEEEILEAVNNLTHSPWYGYEANYTK